jgi:group I intron endonuclease
MFTIYLITNCLNGKTYVGKTTKTLQKRWVRHLWSMKTGDDTYLYRAMRKHGPENFSISFLCEAKDEEELNYLETMWILLLRTKDKMIGYNMTDGGDGRCGLKDSPKTRALKKKIAQGRTFTPQAKARQKEVRATFVGKKAMRFKGDISTEKIIDLYREIKSSRKVAALLGIEKSMVIDRMKKAGEPFAPDSKEIRRRRLEEKDKLHLLEINDDHIADLYVNQNWTMAEIADLYEASHRIVGKRLEKKGIFSTRQANKLKKAA